MPDTIGLIALFVAIGGQYLVLFQLYRMMNRIEIEFATCPYHRKARRPPVGDAE